MSVQNKTKTLPRVRVEPDIRELVELAADAKDQRLSEWIRDTVIRAARTQTGFGA